MSAQISAFVVLMPNINTLALEPMGALAGTAASTIGFVTLALGALVGAVIDLQIVSTVTPLSVGWALSAAIGLLVFLTIIPRRPTQAH